MGFFWLCPCGSRNFYKGGLTTEAVTTCSSCGYKYRIWKYKINEENDVGIEDNKEKYYPFNYKLYFIKTEKYVKIGYTKWIENRFNQLQSSNPNKLELIFLMDNGKDLEIPLHKYYKEHNKHHRGEWFIFDEFTERVIDVLKVYKKQTNKLEKIKNRILEGLK